MSLSCPAASESSSRPSDAHLLGLRGPFAAKGTPTATPRMVRVEKILIVTSSQATLGDTDEPTGVWLPELAIPLLMFEKKGYQVHIASIAGGKVPIDPLSTSALTSRLGPMRRFLGSPAHLALLENTPTIAHIDPSPYAAIFIPGGHGISWDGPFSKEMQRLVRDAYLGNKVIGAVCHGPAALVNVMIDGRPLLAGKIATGFSNSEEDAIGRSALVPFLLEDRIKEVGCKYQRGFRDGAPYAIRAGKIVTGQNPESSQLTAELVIEALSFGVRLCP